MRLLFVCGRNRRRSPTAERIFHGAGGVEAQSAGISPDADAPLSSELIEWADTIFVMEESHRTKLNRQYGPWLRGKRIVCLGIRDDYEYMAPELIGLLLDRVPRSVPVTAEVRPD